MARELKNTRGDFFFGVCVFVGVTLLITNPTLTQRACYACFILVWKPKCDAKIY